MAATLTITALAIVLATVSCQRGARPERQMVTAEECQEKVMDMYFVLDSSSSIWVRDYDREQDFVKDIVARLDISPQATRVGVLTFSDLVDGTPIPLSRYSSKDEFMNNVNVNNLPYRTGITNTHSAIQFVRENSEFRQDITKVIVMVTDGGSASPGATMQEARLAREQGFYIFVVGVGQYLDQQEWRTMASDPDSSFIYNITNFRYLEGVSQSMAPRACLLPPITKDCLVNRAADLFVVAGPGGTEQALYLMEQMYERTTDDRDQVRVSYLMDVCDGAINVEMGDIDSHCDRFLPLGDSSVDAYIALLERLKDQAQANREADDFHGGSQVAILFIDDGSTDNSYSLVQKAREVTQDQVDLVVVDLGVMGGKARYLQSIRRDGAVVRFQEGELEVQGQATQDMLDKTCEGFNMDIFRPVRRTRVPPS